MEGKRYELYKSCDSQDIVLKSKHKENVSPNNRHKYYSKLGIQPKLTEKNYFQQTYNSCEGNNQEGKSRIVIRENMHEEEAREKDYFSRQPITLKVNPVINYPYSSEMVNIDRVSELVYRGDSRTDLSINDCGGFWCPLTNPNTADDKKRWGVGLTEWDSHVENGDGAFVAFTRSTIVAKQFAIDSASSNNLQTGYVYATVVYGGLDVSKHVLSNYSGEQEVSVCGGVDDENIVAVIAVDVKTKKFTGDIFCKNGFFKLPNEVTARIIADLSGESQPIDERLSRKQDEFIFAM